VNTAFSSGMGMGATTCRARWTYRCAWRRETPCVRASRRAASAGGRSRCKHLRAWFTRRECWAAEARFNMTHI
jgi:hypothetical protein